MPGSFSLGIDEYNSEYHLAMSGRLGMEIQPKVLSDADKDQCRKAIADYKRIPMAGLNPQKRYRITELNRIDNNPLAFEGKDFSGEYLMQNGLEIPYGHNADWGKANEWASRVLLLETAE